MSIKIHTNPPNFRSKTVRLVAELAGVPMEVVPVQFSEIKSPEFLKKNPMGQVPCVETPEGYINQSAAQSRHLVRIGKNKSLLGGSNFEQAEVDQWIEYSFSDVEPVYASLIYPIIGVMPFNKDRHQWGKDLLPEVLKQLNQRLENRQWLVGKSVTVADVFIGVQMFVLMRTVVSPKLRAGAPHLMKWFESFTQLPEFKKVGSYIFLVFYLFW